MMQTKKRGAACALQADWQSIPVAMPMLAIGALLTFGCTMNAGSTHQMTRQASPLHALQV